MAAKDPIGGQPGVVLQGLLSVGLLLWSWPLSIQFGAALSGSLTQIAIPLLCLVALARHGDRFGASVALWWTGESLLDLAPYIADARAGADASGRRDGTRGGGP